LPYVYRYGSFISTGQNMMTTRRYLMLVSVSIQVCLLLILMSHKLYLFTLQGTVEKLYQWEFLHVNSMQCMNGDMKSMRTSYASKFNCVNENKKLWISGWVICRGDHQSWFTVKKWWPVVYCHFCKIYLCTAPWCSME
jgi:hypothetical protein